MWLSIMGSMVWPLSVRAEPQWLLQAYASAARTNTHRPLRADIRPAQRDPFDPAPAAASVPPLPPVVVAPPVAAVAPLQPPMPPPPTLAYAGRMRAPDGRWLVMAQLEDGRPVALEVGKELANGYRVERLSDHVVELLHPQTQHLMQLAVPATPRFETW